MGIISDNSSPKQESSTGSPSKPVRTDSQKVTSKEHPKKVPAKDLAEPRNTGKGIKMEATIAPRARAAGTARETGELPSQKMAAPKVAALKSSVSPLEQVRRKAAAAVVMTTSSPAKVGKPVAKKRLSSEDERLLAQILASEQDYIDSPAFYEGEADRKIYDEAPDVPKPDTTWYHPVMDDLSGNDRKRSVKSAQQVILTAAQEKILFHQFNYARHRVWKLQQDVWATATRQPTGEQATEILRWYRLADRIREQIAETNLALVLAMAKRTRMSEVDFADLVSEGNMALLRAVDKFDAGRGYKFSTYACRAILKAFSRQGMKLSKYRQRFPTDFDPKLEKSNFLETKRATFEKDAAEEVKRIVRDNRAELTDVERTVIEHRFGIDSGATEKPMTLEQVGQIIGVTKERVRQIQNKAMEKIRLELEAKFLGNRAAEEAQLAALAAEAEAQNSPGSSRKSSASLSMLN